MKDTDSLGDLSHEEIRQMIVASYSTMDDESVSIADEDLGSYVGIF